MGEPVTGAWTEIREHDGELGPEFAKLLYATVEAVRRFNRFPPPAGTAAWDTRAVQDVAHKYLDDESKRIGRIVGAATSDASFERILQKAITNWFLMAARTTNTGAALAALRHSIDQNPRIISSGTTPTTRTYALQEHAEHMLYSGALQPLVEVAYAVDGVRAAKWKVDAKNRQPIAEPDSLRRVIEAILNAAGAPMTPRQLLQVIQSRFPATTSGDTEEPLDATSQTSGDPTSDDGVVAAAIWEELSPSEKLVVGLSDHTIREVEDATGLSRGTVHRAIQSSAVTVTVHLRGHPTPDGVMRAIKDWSAAARASGTTPKGSASRTSEEDNRDG